MDKSTLIYKNLQESIQLKTILLEDESIQEKINLLSEKIVESYRNNGKVLFCGNGGSAADAQHLAAEFSGRYYYDRPPLPSEALHVNTSYLTAVANDYSYEEVYSRLLQAIGNEGDVLIGLSTSGNSKNVINALEVAQDKKMLTVGFTGQGGGKMAELCDILIEIPSKSTPRIQECHMLVGHTVCEFVEAELFPKK